MKQHANFPAMPHHDLKKQEFQGQKLLHIVISLSTNIVWEYFYYKIMSAEMVQQQFKHIGVAILDALILI